MPRQFLHTCVAASVVFSTFTILAQRVSADVPQTPDRPGRASVTDVANMTDDQLAVQTAKTLSVSATKPLDEQALDWFGVRSALQEKTGLSFEGSWIVDYSKNLRGGANTEGDSVRNLFDLRMNIDTETMFKLPGGTFSLDFQNESGTNGSDDLGDVQGYDNTDADGRTQISELWYEQVLFENRLRIKAGKVDANSEFAYPENGTAFVNSSFGHSPTIIGMPTYPDPSTSLNVFFYPTPSLYAGFGVYDGSGTSGTVTGSYGPARLFHGDKNFFYIAEAGFRWQLKDATLPGRVAIGGHYLDGDFDKFNGGSQSGAGGFYANFDQTLWHKKFYDKGNADGVYAFAQYGHADKHANEVTDYVGAGVTWVGPYEKENADSLGLGVAAARLTDDDGAGFSKRWETSVEAFYNFQVKSYLSIKPDLQYIFNPGGDASFDNALVATIRLTLAY